MFHSCGLSGKAAPNEAAHVYLVIGASFLMGDMCLKDWFASE